MQVVMHVLAKSPKAKSLRESIIDHLKSRDLGGLKSETQSTPEISGLGK
jgi:hypothetical protein